MDDSIFTFTEEVQSEIMEEINFSNISVFEIANDLEYEKQELISILNEYTESFKKGTISKEDYETISINSVKIYQEILLKIIVLKKIIYRETLR